MTSNLSIRQLHEQTIQLTECRKNVYVIQRASHLNDNNV